MSHQTTASCWYPWVWPWLYNPTYQIFFKISTTYFPWFEKIPSDLCHTSIKTIMALTSMMKWSLHQMDVKTAFLNGVIEEEVYIEQLQGFEVEDRANHVCKL